MADGSEPVERRDAQRGGEIAVRAATRGTFSERQPHLPGKEFRSGKKRRAEFSFERRAIEAAVHFQPSAGMNRTKRVQQAFKPAHIRDAQSAKIEDGAGELGDDIYASAAFDDVGIDGNSAARVVPFLNARKLQCQFVDGVHALLGSQARVRSPAMDEKLRFANGFAGRLKQTMTAERRLEHKDGIAAACL